jgi:hypothetical protein
MKMLTIITVDYEKEIICARASQADADGNNAMFGNPTDAEIIEYCKENLAAPDRGDFSEFTIERY